MQSSKSYLQVSRREKIHGDCQSSGDSISLSPASVSRMAREPQDSAGIPPRPIEQASIPLVMRHITRCVIGVRYVQGVLVVAGVREDGLPGDPGRKSNRL